MSLHQYAPFSQDVLLLTVAEDELLLKDPHGKQTLDVALLLHLTQVKINRLHYRNMEFQQGSSTGDLCHCV